MSLCKGKQKVFLLVHSKATMHNLVQPKYMEGLNKAKGLDDNDKGIYMNNNEILVNVF